MWNVCECMPAKRQSRACASTSLWTCYYTNQQIIKERYIYIYMYATERIEEFSFVFTSYPWDRPRSLLTLLSFLSYLSFYLLNRVFESCSPPSIESSSTRSETPHRIVNSISCSVNQTLSSWNLAVLKEFFAFFRTEFIIF